MAALPGAVTREEVLDVGCGGCSGSCASMSSAAAGAAETVWLRPLTTLAFRRAAELARRAA